MTELQNLYEEEESFLDEFFGSIFCCCVAWIINILCIAYIFILYHMTQILNDWPNQKCKPYIIPFAGYINKPPNLSVEDFTFQNFTFCQQNIFKNLMQRMLSPLHSLINSLHAFFNDFENALQAMRIALANLRSSVTKIFQEILFAIGAIIVPLQQIFFVCKDSINKMVGVIMSGIYTLLTVMATFKTTLKIFIDAVVIILIIFAALIISLFADIFTIPIAIAGLAVFVSVSKPFRSLVQFLEDEMGISTSKSIPPDPVAKPAHFCFSYNTMIGDKKIKDYNVGDTLPFSGGIVTAKIQLMPTDHIFYHEKKTDETQPDTSTLFVTGYHKVWFSDNTKWGYVKDHPNFIACKLFGVDNCLYCLNTTTKTIPIKNYLFSDWDEFGESMQQHDYKEPHGLHSRTIMKNGKYAENIQVGDWITQTQQVLGKVWLKNNCISFITSDSHIDTMEKTVPDYNFFAEQYLANLTLSSYKN